MNSSTSGRSLAVIVSTCTLFSLGVAFNSAKGQSGASGSALSGPPTILAEYQARAPRKCASVKGPPSVAQASALIQCSMDGLTPRGLTLIQDVKIEEGTPRRFVNNTDAGLEGIDLNAMVIPLRGSYTSYFCNIVSPQFAPAGKSCQVSPIDSSPGWCWKTSFGDYRCKMLGGVLSFGRGPAPTTYGSGVAAVLPLSAAAKTPNPRQNSPSQSQQTQSDPSIWTDPATGLVWAGGANQSADPMPWQQATDYCTALKTGGASDWRLASIEELQMAFKHDLQKNVTLNGLGAWSSTMDGRVAAWGFNFNLRLRRSDPLTAQYYYWALCVR
jgi:hypothetical protein